MKNLYPPYRKAFVSAFSAILFFTINNQQASAQTAPSFVTSSPTLSVCAGAGATSINTLLKVNDPDVGEEIDWTIGSNPSHGTLGGFMTWTFATGSTLTPGGLTYTPTPGYSGSDAFTITVYDDFFSRSVTVNVTVNAKPTITLVVNPITCLGGTTGNLTYSATSGSPNQYSIAWTAAAIIAGYSNVSNSTLTSTPIVVSVPGAVSAGTYGGNLTVKNSTTGCTSQSYSFNSLVYAKPTITLGSDPAVCNGVTSAPLTYSATTGGAAYYSVVWSAAAITAGFSNVGLTTLPGSQINLTAPSNPAGATYTGTLTVTSSTSGCVSTGNSISVTVNPMNPISSGASQTQDASASSGNYSSGGCNIISKVTPSGANPVSGNVTAKIWIESSVPTQLGRPYVARHYEITPATNASTATGTVTLYFLQSEFDDFNATSAALKLPTGPSDATGKSNLRIGKYSGTSNDNSGLPASYTSGSIVIDPADANIVWNAANSRWEVTFNVSGFSGFIAQTSLFTLPVTWASFTAEKSGEKVLLKWQTANETNTSHFNIEHSVDGQTFQSVGSLNAAGNSNGRRDYSFTHEANGAGTHYYRIKQVDKDGQSNYTETRKISFNGSNSGFTIIANPVKNGSLQVQFDLAGTAIIYDATGHVRAKQQANAGVQSINVSNLPKGIYLLKALGETKKFIIE